MWGSWGCRSVGLRSGAGLSLGSFLGDGWCQDTGTWRCARPEAPSRLRDVGRGRNGESKEERSARKAALPRDTGSGQTAGCQQQYVQSSQGHDNPVSTHKPAHQRTCLSLRRTVAQFGHPLPSLWRGSTRKT